MKTTEGEGRALSDRHDTVSDAVLLGAALAYAEGGLALFPLHETDVAGVCSCGRPDCSSPGKHPRTPHGHKDAVTDAAQIRSWWTRWPRANIGMSCGASDRVVVDVDDKDERPGPDTWHALRDELAGDGDHGDLEQTAMVETPSGGFHAHYLAAPHRVGSRNDLLGPGIDVKAEGGYVLLPPSRIAGVEYAWVEGHGIEKTAAIPEALAGRIAFVARPSAAAGAGPASEAGEQIAKGRRNETLFRAACAMHRGGHTRYEIEAAATEMNKRCAPPLSCDELQRIIGSATGYAASDQEAHVFARTDAGNAELFCALNGDRVRHDYRRGVWLLYDDHHWAEDADGAVYRLAVEAARHRYREAVALDELAAREKEARFAVQSENRSRLEAMLALARTRLPIATSGEEWNRDPLTFACANGVIELTSGRLRAGRPEELISIASPVTFDQAASCARWQRFLGEVFGGDAELIDWIWRFVGYLLCGLASEQCFLLCYGVGANGKSTFLGVLRRLLGGYAANAPFSTFEASSRGQIPNDLAALAGRRLVTSSETGENTPLNEARLKMLTGGDPVTARFLHREFFTFVPVAKFVLAVNHKPRVRDYSHGFWRRLCLVPFEARFSGAAADKRLDEKLAAELPGILAWAVRGHLEWRARGLAPPASVRAATDAYRCDSDPLAAFLAERCRAEEGSTARAAAIFEAYAAWADEQALPEAERLPRNRFYELLEGHFPKRRTKHGVLYLGLRVCDPAAPSLDQAEQG